MTQSFTHASEDKHEHRRKMMPQMMRRTTSRVRDEIAEGLVEYDDDRTARRNVLHCGTITVPAQGGSQRIDFSALSFSRGAFPLYIYSAGWKAVTSKSLYH